MNETHKNTGERAFKTAPVYPKHVPSSQLISEILKLGWAISDGKDHDGQLTERKAKLEQLADMDQRPVLPDGTKVIPVDMFLGIYPFEATNWHSVWIHQEARTGFALVPEELETDSIVYSEFVYDLQPEIEYSEEGKQVKLTDPQAIAAILNTFAATPEESVAKALGR